MLSSLVPPLGKFGQKRTAMRKNGVGRSLNFKPTSLLKALSKNGSEVNKSSDISCLTTLKNKKRNMVDPYLLRIDRYDELILQEYTLSKEEQAAEMDRKMDDIISKEYGSTPRNVQENLTVEGMALEIINNVISNVFVEEQTLSKINSTQALIEKEQREKVGLKIPELDL